MRLNKAIYVGNNVLELNKLAMYQFYHKKVKKKCKRCILLFTDTDSLCIETEEEEEFYEIMHQCKDLHDLRNFHKNSKYFCNDNKKVPRRMKDEYGGSTIDEFIGIRSKMYSILNIYKKEKSVHKGHNADIRYDQFKDTLINKKVNRHNMSRIKPVNRILVTYESNEISLSAFDDKRYLLDDGINTLPYGHKDIIKKLTK